MNCSVTGYSTVASSTGAGSTPAGSIVGKLGIFMNLPVNRIICGNAQDTLKTLPDSSINCCISSPPYWALRDYGIDGQLGLESTFEEYIDKLCGIYDEVKRVLRKDGTCFVNLGDTYAGSNQGAGTTPDREISKKQLSNRGTNWMFDQKKALTSKISGVQNKSLILIPQRFAIEMVSRGWILRNVLIWHKPNPMPSSAKDRFTVDFEYVYFFVKNKKYWFEQQFEAYTLPMNRWGGIYTDGNVPGSKYLKEDIDPAQLTQRLRSMRPNELGRNKRCVWTIPTEPRSEAHFATFPQKLVEPMILSGCPRYICVACGKAREKIYEKEGVNKYTEEGVLQGNPTKIKWNDSHPNYNARWWSDFKDKGYTDCGCGAEWRPGIVIDQFCGSATVCRVAAQNQRDYIGIDLNPEYIEKIAIPFVNEVETGVGRKETGQQALFP